LYINSTGNVGIGTTSPDAQLEISNSTTTSGAGGATLRLTRSDSTSVEGDPVGTIEFYSTDADGPKTTAYIKSMSEELYGRKGSLAFGTSITNNTDAVEAMRIDSSGDVGIGVTNPDARIHAVYSGLAAKFVSSQATGLEVQGGGNSQPIARFKDTSASEKVTIASTGNLGIGTTSPGEKLTVHSTATAIQTLYTTNTQGGYTGYHNSTGGVKGFVGYGPTLFTGLDINNFGLRSQGGMPFATGGGSVRMYINSSGNVGIGTTSPGYTLDVNGSLHSTNITIADAIYHEGDTNTYTQFHAADQWRVVTGGIERFEVTNSQVLVNNSYFKIQNSGDRLMNVDTVNGTFFLGDVDGLSDENYITSENGRIDLVSGGGETLSCTNAGKVGIGDINPSTKLSVNGGVQIANESATASAALVGTLRYRSTANTSFVDMCMQTGATTYTWVNIVSNFW
jgi:hypothetical protein